MDIETSVRHLESMIEPGDICSGSAAGRRAVKEAINGTRLLNHTPHDLHQECDEGSGGKYIEGIDTPTGKNAVALLVLHLELGRKNYGGNLLLRNYAIAFFDFPGSGYSNNIN